MPGIPEAAYLAFTPPLLNNNLKSLIALDGAEKHSSSPAVRSSTIRLLVVPVMISRLPREPGNSISLSGTTWKGPMKGLYANKQMDCETAVQTGQWVY